MQKEKRQNIEDGLIVKMRRSICKDTGFYICEIRPNQPSEIRCGKIYGVDLGLFSARMFPIIAIS